MTATVITGQSLLDIAVEHCGTVEALMELAALNGMEPDAVLPAGSVLLLPDTDFGALARRIAQVFRNNRLHPATDYETLYLGIGDMIIEYDFIVS